MLPSFESDPRSQKIKEAPRELVDPVKRLVGELERRFKQEPYVEEDHQVRRIYLRSVNGVYYLELSAVSEHTMPLSRRKKEEDKEGIAAYFVGGFVVEPENGELLCKLDEIQLPGSPDLVNQDSIFILRGCDIREVGFLTEIINSSSQLNENREDFWQRYDFVKDR